MTCPACNDALRFDKDFESSAKTIADLEQYATACKYCQILLSVLSDCRPEMIDDVIIRSDERNRCTKGITIYYRYQDGFKQTPKKLFSVCNLIGMCSFDRTNQC
jgi:hypothetical protein